MNDTHPAFPLTGDLGDIATRCFQSPEWRHLPSEVKDEFAEAIAAGDRDACRAVLERIVDLLPRLRR